MKYFFIALTFVLGAFLGVWIVQLAGGERVTPAKMRGQQAKRTDDIAFEHYDDQRGQYDVVHIGSSRIRRHLSPVHFDARMRELGYTTTSYNLGQSGGQGVRTEEVLRFVLSKKPYPKIVVVEAFPFYKFKDDSQSLTTSIKVIIENLQRDVNIRMRVGYGVMILSRLAERVGGPETGYGKNHARSNAVHVGFSPHAAMKEGKVVGLAAPESGISRSDRQANPFMPNQASVPGNALAYERFERAMREHVRNESVHLIVVCPPGNGKYLREKASKDTQTIFMNQPSLYPSIYQIDNWHDRGHLNEKGAAIFSRLFADEVAKRIE